MWSMLTSNGYTQFRVATDHYEEEQIKMLAILKNNIYLRIWNFNFIAYGNI